MYRISVIVPTYRRFALLTNTLKTLCNQAVNDNYEIIIVDNYGSKKLSKYIEFLKKSTCLAIRYIFEHRTGLHFARHTGLKTAQGNIVAFVDDDVLCPVGWLAAMLEPYKDPQVACVGGKIKAKWDSAPPNWIASFFGGWFSILDLGDSTLELKQGEYVYGCNMSLRRDILFKSGGFNPDGYGNPNLIWFRGDGECGLIDKIQALGFKVIYEPRAWLYHYIPESRMTEEYLYRRAFTDGISKSYKQFRLYPTHRLGLIYRITKDAMHWIYWRVKSSVGHSQYDWSIRKRMVVQEYRAKIIHGLMLIFRQELRAHVCKASYLDE